MRRRRFSPREHKIVNGVIQDICHFHGFSPQDLDATHIGWVAFIAYYQDYCTSSRPIYQNEHFWEGAFSFIQDALIQEKRTRDFLRYRLDSLERPISSEDPTPYRERLPARHSDFQDSVCFYDYLRSQETDIQLMAFDLIHGDSLDEIRRYHHWSSGRTCQVYHDLTLAMEVYQAI